MITEAHRRDLHGYLGGTISGLGAVPLAVGGVEDHVHILAGLTGRHAAGDLVREAKKASTSWMRGRQNAFQWQEGHAAFSIGRSELAAVKNYIGIQEEHHRTRSSVDELLALLAEHDVPFDPKFFE